MAETRLLTIMGSGETSPTMVTPHQRIFARLAADGPVPAVMLDTPFGFQENVDILTAKTLEYFKVSVGRPVGVASFRSAATVAADPLATEQALEALRTARWAFAGPGSPSYALRTWSGTPIAAILGATLRRDGAVIFASAAALTLGLVTVPVYEIYKVGEEPRWLDGLDILGVATGWRAAVIPHYDNAEGGNHDTRFCYLGERRLATLERALPDDTFVLGVDEHTAVLCDLVAGTLSVVGRGRLTLRRDGESSEFPAGSTLALDEVPGLAGGPGRAGRSGLGAAPSSGTPHPGASADDDPVPSAPSVGAAAAGEEQEFASALRAGDTDAAVAATLRLEDALVAWSADPTQSADADAARAALRAMIVRLGTAAGQGGTDPRATVEPFVTALLAVRAAARTAGAYPIADQVRDALTGMGVEVRDGTDGVSWELHPPDPTG